MKVFRRFFIGRSRHNNDSLTYNKTITNARNDNPLLKLTVTPKAVNPFGEANSSDKDITNMYKNKTTKM